MSSAPWLSVRNWRRFQNYKDRNPPWVRWYTDQLDDDDLRSLRPMTRLFWSNVCLVAARKENVIPNDSPWLAQEMGLSRQAVTAAVKELVQAGYLLEHASKGACVSAAKRDSASRDARTETETETEGQDRSSRSEITSEPRPDLTDSDNLNEPDEQPFAREPEPDFNGYDLPTREQRPQLEPDDSMERLGAPADVEELVQRWSQETA